MKWWWSRSLFLSSPYKCVVQRECTEDLLWWRWRSKSLGSSYQEARSIYEHVLNSCCRNQPSKTNQEMPWAPRPTSIIPCISFFYLLSFTFFSPTLLCCYYSCLSFLLHFYFSWQDQYISFYSLQFFSLIKGMAACCAFNTGFLEKNKLNLQATANSLKSALTIWSPQNFFQDFLWVVTVSYSCSFKDWIRTFLELLFTTSSDNKEESTSLSLKSDIYSSYFSAIGWFFIKEVKS